MGSDNILQKFRLDGKRAVVTGAARGIGLACARGLLQAGARVVLSDLSQDALTEAQAKLRDEGLASEGYVLDVTDSDAVTQAASDLESTYGPIDILVNNAGIAISNHPAESMSDEVWKSVMDVNLNGVFWCCRAFGSKMLKSGAGAIVNIGSMSADIVNRPQEQANYNASKAGVHHLTKSLAAEWASRGVRVNAVAPTYISTEMNAYVGEDNEMYDRWIDGTPMGRLGRPDEVAAVVLFLASDAASLLTGSVVMADGGYTCW